ncbi:hypothetical protein DYB32_003691 [Aphanomyces invadans]|uniref:Uncharacterized protein n=1 Tax=Aphanomyces invadans TaxID=157072 RepID=A0A3R6ZS36_9STRA|nr:hypothetical protein DYB32_003691 [Aphanomyces invadans]
MLAHDEVVDYFSLHKRKSKEVDVDMLDYEYVASCSDIDLLKNILVVLKSGKEGRYPQLEAAVEERLMEVLPPSEKQRILRMKARPSEADIHNETASLTTWEAQMAAKSAELDAARKMSHRSVPPPRGSEISGGPATAVRLSTKQAATPVPKREKKAIHAYDWRAWEKFDVEAAERELDMEDVRRKEMARQQQEELAARQARKRLDDAAMPASVDVDAMSSAERDVCAALEKQKGNEAFRSGDNEDAVRAYSRSLVFDPSSAVVFANRALVHLKLKNLSSAEDDCTMALRRDPRYFKAWSRMTRFRRGKYEDAISDFEVALQLQPQNREIQKLLQKTKEKWAEVDGTKADSTATTPAPVATSQPAAPFQRFEIIESDDDDDKEDTTPTLEKKQPRNLDERNGKPPAQPAEDQPFQRFEIIEDDDE